MAILAGTRTKNSGILRYNFGNFQPGPEQPGTALTNLVGLAPATIVTCLGANIDVIVDSENQIFGPCPGHLAINGDGATLFGGVNVPQRDAIDPGSPLPPGTGRAMGYIPTGTKCHAYFILTDFDPGITTEVPNIPVIVVQVEVTATPIVRAGVQDPVGGKEYIGSIRVAIRNVGAADTAAAGTLVVELQHSEHDIPGVNAWQTGLLSQPG
jgi:hypothetical protein